ncbi:hypothetical protein Tco_0991587 [Tanacetum coccineum]|uniref:Uncharacterized protein n=1 Tax=Tanacetum coccineum TaxID=301880 RepID=A0ABQ5EZP1_9ASTR
MLKRFTGVELELENCRFEKLELLTISYQFQQHVRYSGGGERSWEKLVYEFSNESYPCRKLIEGFFPQAISGSCPPRERKEKASTYIDVVDIRYLKVEGDFIELTDVGHVGSLCHVRQNSACI